MANFKFSTIFIILIIILFIPLFDLFNQGLPLTHDGQDHIFRIANFYQSLQEGSIIPRWAANLNYGYGHPILMFLYPLSSYLASLFHLLGFSFVDSTKIVFGLAFILSGVTMYIWLKELVSREAAFVGALLYTFAPYRFIDLYVRGALGEHTAFVFPPLILYFLYKSSKKASYWYLAGGALSLAGLILAHNAISLMFMPIIIFYIFFLIWQAKNKIRLIYMYTGMLFIGFGLSAFFWMPAFIEGKYTLRDIVTKNTALSRFVSFKDLLYGPWSYGISGQFTVQVGILHWLNILFSVPVGLYLFKKHNKNWIFVFFFILFFSLAAFLMLPVSKPVWEIVTTLQKFQFPWRFLSLSVFTSAVVGAFVISTISAKKQNIIIVFVVFLILFLNKDYWKAKDFLIKPEEFYTGIYNKTTDTGESSPIWSVRFMEQPPKDAIEVIDGKAEISKLARISTRHTYNIISSEKVKLRENTLYFPGWHIFIDGKEIPVEFQDPNSRGLITFWVEKGEHKINVEFRETKLRLLADLLSLGSLFILVVLGILNKKKIWLS